MDRGNWWAVVHEFIGVGHDLATKPSQRPPKSEPAYQWPRVWIQLARIFGLACKLFFKRNKGIPLQLASVFNPLCVLTPACSLLYSLPAHEDVWEYILQCASSPTYQQALHKSRETRPKDANNLVVKAELGPESYSSLLSVNKLDLQRCFHNGWLKLGFERSVTKANLE